MLNFCINFLNKAAKLLTILYDFAVASYMDAWIKKTMKNIQIPKELVASYMDAWIKNGETIHQKYLVASFVDAWIKMMKKYLLSELLFSRTLGVCRSK